MQLVKHHQAWQLPNGEVVTIVRIYKDTITTRDKDNKQTIYGKEEFLLNHEPYIKVGNSFLVDGYLTKVDKIEAGLVYLTNKQILKPRELFHKERSYV